MNGLLYKFLKFIQEKINKSKMHKFLNFSNKLGMLQFLYQNCFIINLGMHDAYFLEIIWLSKINLGMHVAYS